MMNEGLALLHCRKCMLHGLYLPQTVACAGVAGFRSFGVRSQVSIHEGMYFHEAATVPGDVVGVVAEDVQVVVGQIGTEHGGVEIHLQAPEGHVAGIGAKPLNEFADEGVEAHFLLGRGDEGTAGCLASGEPPLERAGLDAESALYAVLQVDDPCLLPAGHTRFGDELHQGDRAHYAAGCEAERFGVNHYVCHFNEELRMMNEELSIIHY